MELVSFKDCLDLNCQNNFAVKHEEICGEENINVLENNFKKYSTGK